MELSENCYIFEKGERKMSNFGCIMDTTIMVAIVMFGDILPVPAMIALKIILGTCWMINIMKMVRTMKKPTERRHIIVDLRNGEIRQTN